MRTANATPATFDADSWPAAWVLEILARNGSAAEFYNSPAWKRLKRKVLRDQHGECWCHLHPERFEFLRGQKPQIVRGTVVHHVHPLRQRPDLALSELDEAGEKNLICVCPSCHWPLDHPKRRTPDIPERW